MTETDCMSLEKKAKKGLTNFIDSVKASIQGREDYKKKRGGRLITATETIQKAQASRYLKTKM